eukprot:5204994-Pyramimonas_sp.AAC.2
MVKVALEHDIQILNLKCMNVNIKSFLDDVLQERTEDYFNQLAARGLGPGLKVAFCDDNTTRGKGLFATREFEEDEPVLIEPPLVAAQVRYTYDI